MPSTIQRHRHGLRRRRGVLRLLTALAASSAVGAIGVGVGQVSVTSQVHELQTFSSYPKSGPLAG
jgi:hypothetical protein